MNTCPSCGAPAINSSKPSGRQFYACSSYSYGSGELTDQTYLCRAWQRIRDVLDIMNTDSETKEQLIARVRAILQE